TAKGTVEVGPGGINATSKFNIAPEDYKINIPGVVREKIAKSLEITVTMKYTPLATK
ncbi:MAG: YceI family protein, partial [Odoribacter sp.]|nr:YceI family protein [Odoribacter sp.]